MADLKLPSRKLSVRQIDLDEKPHIKRLFDAFVAEMKATNKQPNQLDFIAYLEKTNFASPNFKSKQQRCSSRDFASKLIDGAQNCDGADADKRNERLGATGVAASDALPAA